MNSDRRISTNPSSSRSSRVVNDTLRFSLWYQLEICRRLMWWETSPWDPLAARSPTTISPHEDGTPRQLPLLRAEQTPAASAASLIHHCLFPFPPCIHGGRRSPRQEGEEIKMEIRLLFLQPHANENCWISRYLTRTPDSGASNEVWLQVSASGCTS